MPIITQNAAEQAIRPYINQFVEIVLAAFSDWLKNPYAAQMQTKSFRAHAVSNQMLVHAKRIFDTVDGVRVASVPNYIGILVGSDIFIRMKKADERMLSRNYPTKNALAFVDQEQELFGGLTRLELVYQLDDVGAEVERIVLMQRHKCSVVWTIDLFGSAPMVQNVLPFAPQIDDGSSSVANRIVKPKRKTNREKQDVSTG